MAKRLQVVFDCADPDALAHFWAEATGYILQPPPEGFDSWEDFLRKMDVPEDKWDKASAIVDPDGVGPRIYFQKVPEGKTVKNRVHIDINQGTRETPMEERRRLVEAEADRLKGFGATQFRRVEEDGEFCIVMQDPEGNEFCLQ
jgi:hypothetical protein